MKVTSLLAASALATAIASPMVVAADAVTSEQQKKEIETVVHDYLVNHPEVLVEASQVLQKRQQESAQQQAKQAIVDNVNPLLTGKWAVAGNPQGNVTLVEFFDYQCIHCKKMAPTVDSLIKKDGQLRVVYKEFPIFGGSSELASQVALAAAMQGKYAQMHNALIQLDKRLDDKLVMATAKSVGLNMAQLQKDMKSKTVMDEKMHLMGTPAFVIVPTPQGQFSNKVEPAFIPGAASEQALQDLIKKANG